MRACTADELAEALRSGANVFDTRPPSLRSRVRWPGTRPLSLEAVKQGAYPDIPKQAPVFLVCERGHYSELVGLYLEEAGFRDVRHLPGGFGRLIARTAAARQQEQRP